MFPDVAVQLTADIPLLSIISRLSIAAVLGAVIGFDRERHDKPAGLRTHMLVALGSATFVLLAFEVGAELVDRYGEGALDPTRVLQGVVGGIGFLGAGSIIQARGRISGVTTAASVWMAGALGAAAGVGAYVVALVATVLTVLILTTLRRFERAVHKRGRRRKRLSEADDERPAPPRSDDASTPFVQRFKPGPS